MVASQITVPFAGWPYNVILSRLGPITKEEELVETALKTIVNAYVTQFDDLPGGDRLAMTVLDLRQQRNARSDSRAWRRPSTRRWHELQHRHHGGAARYLHGRRRGRCEAADRPHDLMRNPARQGNRPDGRGDPKGRQRPARRVEAGAAPEPDGGRRRRAATARAHAHRLQAGTSATGPISKGIGIYAPFITDQGILDRLELAQPKDGEGSLKRGRKDYDKLALFKDRKNDRNTWPPAWCTTTSSARFQPN